MELEDFTTEDKKGVPSNITRAVTVGLQKKMAGFEELFKKYNEKTDSKLDKTDSKLKTLEELILKQNERQDKIEYKMSCIENKIDLLIQFVQSKFDSFSNNMKVNPCNASNQSQVNVNNYPVLGCYTDSQQNLNNMVQQSSLQTINQYSNLPTNNQYSNLQTNNQYTNIPQNMSYFKKERNSSDQLNECLKDIPSPHLIKRTASFSSQQLNDSKNNDIKNFISDIKNDRKYDKKIGSDESKQMDFNDDIEKTMSNIKNSRKKEDRGYNKKMEEDISKNFNYSFKEIRSEKFDSIDNNFIKNCLNLNSIEGEILLFKKMYIDGVPKEYYPIRHIKKKFQYWFEGHMKDDNGTYLIDTIIKNIEQLYFKINIDYDENPDQLITNQEYIFTLSEQKYKDKFIAKMINIIDH